MTGSISGTTISQLIDIEKLPLGYGYIWTRNPSDFLPFIALFRAKTPAGLSLKATFGRGISQNRLNR